MLLYQRIKKCIEWAVCRHLRDLFFLPLFWATESIIQIQNLDKSLFKTTLKMRMPCTCLSESTIAFFFVLCFTYDSCIFWSFQQLTCYPFLQYFCNQHNLPLSVLDGWLVAIGLEHQIRLILGEICKRRVVRRSVGAESTVIQWLHWNINPFALPMKHYGTRTRPRVKSIYSKNTK